MCTGKQKLHIYPCRIRNTYTNPKYTLYTHKKLAIQLNTIMGYSHVEKVPVGRYSTCSSPCRFTYPSPPSPASKPPIPTHQWFQPTYKQPTSPARPVSVILVGQRLTRFGCPVVDIEWWYIVLYFLLLY